MRESKGIYFWVTMQGVKCESVLENKLDKSLPKPALCLCSGGLSKTKRSVYETNCMFNYFQDLDYYPIEKDALGKVVACTFFKEIAKTQNRDIEVDKKHKGRKGYPGDIRLRVFDKSFEIKTSSLLLHATAGWFWIFSKTKLTGKGIPKPHYDFLFCVGLPPIEHEIRTRPHQP